MFEENEIVWNGQFNNEKKQTRFPTERKQNSAAGIKVKAESEWTWPTTGQQGGRKGLSSSEIRLAGD